jgi:thiol-disulfide isomerase/thioredoxin
MFVASREMRRASQLDSKFVRHLSLSLPVVLIFAFGSSTRADSRGDKTIGDSPGRSPQIIDSVAKSLEQFKGKIVLLDLWATWCPPRPRVPRVAGFGWKKACRWRLRAVD